MSVCLFIFLPLAYFLVLNEFTGKFLDLRVRRKLGMERARLLDADGFVPLFYFIF